MSGQNPQDGTSLQDHLNAPAMQEAAKITGGLPDEIDWAVGLQLQGMIARAIDTASQEAYLRGVSADERVRERVMTKLPADHPYRGVITRAEQRGRVAGLIAARDAMCPECRAGIAVTATGDRWAPYIHDNHTPCWAINIRELIAAAEAARG